MADVINLADAERSRDKPNRRKAKAKAAKPVRKSKRRQWDDFETALLTTPLAMEMMSGTEIPPPLPREQPMTMESGVLAFRREDKGGLSILLISRRHSKKWGIPKGKVEPHLSFRDNAVKEAFEEAGVVGSVSPHSVGVFRARKRLPNAQTHETMEIWVYLLEVVEMLSDWPEKGKRAIRWVTCEAAARQFGEPVLVRLCQWLARG